MNEDPRARGGVEPAAPNTLGDGVVPNVLAGAPPPAWAPPGDTGPGAPPAWSGPPAWAPPPERSKATGRRRLAGVAGVVLVVVVGLVIRFAVGTAVSGIADQLALSGTPFGRLPAADRAAYSTRLENALGDRTKGLSDAEVAALVQEVEALGLPRLGDTALLDRLAIMTAALDAVDDPSCAAFGRTSLNGQEPSEDTSRKITAAIPDDRIVAWVEISVRGVELGASSTATVPPTDAAATNAAYVALFGALSPAEMDRVVRVTGDVAAASDDDLCWTVRTIYREASDLPLAQRVLVARDDVAP